MSEETITQFFIDELPNDAEFVKREVFVHLYGNDIGRLSSEFQMVDPRLRQIPYAEDTEGYFEIKDIVPARTGGDGALCSVSLFDPGFKRWEARRRPFEEYLDGLRDLIAFMASELPNQTLRVYIANRIWEILHTEKIFEAGHVDFVRMAHDSWGSLIGSVWRFMALDDTRYPYVYIEDVDDRYGVDNSGNRTKVNRLRLDQSRLDRRLHRGVESPVHFASAVTFLRKEAPVYEKAVYEIEFFIFKGGFAYPAIIPRFSSLCLVNASTLTRGPKPLPFDSIVPILCELLNRNDELTLYLPETNVYTRFMQASGAYEYNTLDEHWLFPLTRLVQSKFWIPPQKIPLIDFVNRFGKDCFLVRMYHQMMEENGHYLVIEGKETDGFAFFH